MKIEEQEIKLTVGQYTVRFNISNPHRSKYACVEYRYFITDPTGFEHPSRLTGTSLVSAVSNACQDIISNEEALEDNEKAKALETTAVESG